MQKQWEILMQGEHTEKGLFRKKIITSEACSWYVIAESESEAIDNAIAKWYDKQAHLLFGYPKVIRCLGNWDNWTVEKAMKRLKGKEFAEWAKQQNLSSFFKYE